MGKFNKVKISVKKLTALCIVSAVIGTSVVGFNIVGNKDKLPKESEVTVQTIQEKSTQEILKYDNATLLVSIKEMYHTGESGLYSYAYSTSKTDTLRGYVYTDSYGNVLEEVWDIKDGVEMLVYGNDVGAWVKPEEVIDEEPFYADLWNIAGDLTGYELLDELSDWNGEECYVLITTGATEEYSLIGEEFYIRTSDFMPIACVTYITRSVEGNSVSDVTDEYQNIDSDVDSATVTSDMYDEYMQIYEFQFSNDNIRLYDWPEEYISEMEYYEILSKLDAVEEE